MTRPTHSKTPPTRPLRDDIRSRRPAPSEARA
ncbi:hypothetical protein SAMN04489720_1210 [Agrococcus jejuensis]|uniref:Uncharacterized protein n=1 Tax=Agrococcus jejuensis TaxID=399736 RepID=A0A1G8C9M5_9MICO|nr:hypothetical protein SAMN04489720_1210 [Agrococcus jejuensis]